MGGHSPHDVVWPDRKGGSLLIMRVEGNGGASPAVVCFCGEEFRDLAAGVGHLIAAHSDPGARIPWGTVALLAMDGDGVWTDGGVYYGGGPGRRVLKFSRRDGLGLAQLHHAGVKTALLTYSDDPAFKERATDLGITHVFFGCTDKASTLRMLMEKLALAGAQVAYMGDDLNDVTAMVLAGIPIAVADADPEVKAEARYVTAARGGAGAVREVCDLIVAAKAMGTA